jgi:hypothetical protein
MRNDIDEAVIGHTFAAWQIEHLQRAAVPSGTRTLEVIRLHGRPGAAGRRPSATPATAGGAHSRI